MPRRVTCVYGYEGTLLAYEASLAPLRTRLKFMGIPQSERPSRIITTHPLTRDTFEAMERALEAKQRGRGEGGS